MKLQFQNSVKLDLTSQEWSSNGWSVPINDRYTFFDVLLFLQVAIATRPSRSNLVSVTLHYITFLSHGNRNAWEIQAAVLGEREQPQYSTTTEFFKLLLFLQVVIAKRPSVKFGNNLLFSVTLDYSGCRLCGKGAATVRRYNWILRVVALSSGGDCQKTMQVKFGNIFLFSVRLDYSGCLFLGKGSSHSTALQPNSSSCCSFFRWWLPKDHASQIW